MADLRDAARQALEALERADCDNYEPQHDSAIIALRAALAQQEQEAVITPAELSAALGWPGGISDPVLNKAELLAMVASTRRETEQEPAAWLHDKREYVSVNKNDIPKHQMLAAGWTPLYTAPPRREWVSLTEEEIEDDWERITGHSIFGGDRSKGRQMYLSPDEVMEFARAVEAALREKNALAQPEPPCPYVRHGRDGTHWCALAEQSAQPATITSPRGSLGEPIV